MSEKNVRYCPLLSIFTSTLQYCEEGCAWFNEHTGKCAILLLVEAVQDIAKEIERVEYEMRVGLEL
ncbi:MAG: hypothetical protein LZ173_09690 [Thaumarchaeota archaeon]|jgi:hypothetical protein|nr:hypothetical protein [Candidatus Geocrenenecus arthurdayi]